MKYLHLNEIAFVIAHVLLLLNAAEKGKFDKRGVFLEFWKCFGL